VSYAIDFGTTNTVITRWNRATQQGEIVALPPFSQILGNNPALIPSLLYVEKANQGQVLLGKQVLNQGRDNPLDSRFFRNFKRGIGAPVQGFLPELDGCAVSFEKLGQWYLQRLIDGIAKQEATDLTALVLTVPVDSFESYRYWLSQTCQDWGIEEIRLLDEPTAAALGYDLGDANQVLVLDFGGGTVDFSWVQLDANQTQSKGGFLLKWGGRLRGNSGDSKPKLAKVIAKAGANLGGSDIDHWIGEYFVKTQGIKISAVVKRLAERLKIALSRQPQAEEVYFDDQTFESYQFSLNREQLAQILTQHQVFARLEALLAQVWQTAQLQGLTPQNLDAVLVVGGTSQLPMIQDWIESQFPKTKIHNHQPFAAIALGALQLYSGKTVQDYLYHSYGVRYWNRRKNRHNWHPIIKSGQPYPMTEAIAITLGASLENQPSIELIIGELGSTAGATEVYFDGNQLMTRVLSHEEFAVHPLNDRDGARQIAQLSPPGKPGGDRLKVEFWVDENRYLRLSVEDLLQQTPLLTNQVVAQLH
jgi:molecular chaperone DnaK (HSP70)